jgi:hypothetical protein
MNKKKKQANEHDGALALIGSHCFCFLWRLAGLKDPEEANNHPAAINFPPTFPAFFQ